MAFTKKRITGRKEREKGGQRTNAPKEQREESRRPTYFLVGQHTVFHAGRQYIRHKTKPTH